MWRRNNSRDRKSILLCNLSIIFKCILSYELLRKKKKHHIHKNNNYEIRGNSKLNASTPAACAVVTACTAWTVFESMMQQMVTLIFALVEFTEVRWLIWSCTAFDTSAGMKIGCTKLESTAAPIGDRPSLWMIAIFSVVDCPPALASHKVTSNASTETNDLIHLLDGFPDKTKYQPGVGRRSL